MAGVGVSRVVVVSIAGVGISRVIVVSIAGVVGSIAVGGIGSIGRGAAIGVGGGDHGMAGGAAHVHLLTMIHAPLGLVSRASMTVAISI